MGDMGELFRALREKSKEIREEKRNKYEPMLIEIGAVKKSEGIWQKDDWFLYPTKGFGMNKHNIKRRINLDKFIENIKKEEK